MGSSSYIDVDEGCAYLVKNAVNVQELSSQITVKGTLLSCIMWCIILLLWVVGRVQCVCMHLWRMMCVCV
jgi:hypothetical protein